MDLAALAGRAADEIGHAARRVAAADALALQNALTGAGRILIHGAGREGLMMRALAMRLYHLGLNAHVVGEMDAPPVGPGDLLLVASGPGSLPTILALVQMARQAGARTACITAQPTGPVPAACDLAVTIPAQTMADDDSPRATSVLPMGSVFEGALFLMSEAMILALRDRLGLAPDAMRARHTNLE